MGGSIRHMGGSIRHMGATMSSGVIEAASYASGATSGGTFGPSFTILNQGRLKESSRGCVRSGEGFGASLTQLPKLAVFKDGGSGGGSGGGGASGSGGGRLGFPDIQASGRDVKMNARCEGGGIFKPGEAASNRGMNPMKSRDGGCDGEGLAAADYGS